MLRRVHSTSICLRKNEDRNLFEKHKLRLGDNIKIVLKGIGLYEVNWNNMVHDRDKKIN